MSTVELLNRAIAEEEQALHQYVYFHLLLHERGFELLSRLFKKVAVEEMRHVERFAERVLFLGGEPVLGKLAGPLERIKDPLEMLRWAVEAEREAVKLYAERALKAHREGDLGTHELFKAVLLEEERHLELFERELNNVKEFGPSYLSQQALERSRKELS
ncbi:MAG: bacterioferritin [Aquificae bacterium]|nr:bacterioferritin [Aquificota bacterium]